MKKTLHLSITTMLLILFSILTGATAQNIPEPVKEVFDSFEKTYDVNPNGRLTVTLDIGTVDVQTAAQDRVAVVVTKKAKRQLDRHVQEALADFKVTFDSSHSGVSVRGTFQRGRNYWRYWRRQLKHLDICFLVTVPRRYNVDLNTQSGNISTDGLTGAVQAQTAAGNMRFNGVKGPISGRSNAGNITLANCQGTVDLKTSVGNIQAEVLTQPQHQWTLRTSTGNITGTLNSNIAVEIDARTSIGNISTDFMDQGLELNVVETGLLGNINGGGPLLKFHTSVGNIYLLRN